MTNREEALNCPSSLIACDTEQHLSYRVSYSACSNTNPGCGDVTGLRVDIFERPFFLRIRRYPSSAGSVQMNFHPRPLRNTASLRPSECVVPRSC